MYACLHSWREDSFSVVRRDRTSRWSQRADRCALDTAANLHGRGAKDVKPGSRMYLRDRRRTMPSGFCHCGVQGRILLHLPVQLRWRFAEDDLARLVAPRRLTVGVRALNRVQEQAGDLPAPDRLQAGNWV